MIKRIAIFLALVLALAGAAFAADLRLQATEEVVGANHATKSDTVFRVHAVETDIDGHGKVRYLKEQSSAPTVPSDEGALYTADDGGDTVLLYRSDGESVEVARPGLGRAPPGYIAGLQISRSDTNELTVQPGAVDIEGKLYVLTSSVEIAVGSVASLSWRALAVTPPTSGSALSSSNFSDIAISDVVKSSDGTYWHRTSYTDRRVIGLYPVASSDVLSGFATTIDGKYKVGSYYQVVNDSSPPTTATPTDIGLPALTGSVGQILVRSAAGTSATRLGVTLDGIKIADAPGRYVTGWAEAFSDDGTVDLSVACTGDTATLLDVRLVSVGVPVGMAR